MRSMQTLKRLGDQGGRRTIRFPESISRWTVSCIITVISQFSLLLVLFYSPSLSVLPNLFLSGGTLFIVAVVGKVFKRLLSLRASAPALVFFNILYIWLVYFAVLRPAISPTRSILFNGSLVLLVFGFVRILGSDPGLVRENNSNDTMHYPDSYSSNHEEFQVPTYNNLGLDNLYEGASFSMRRVRCCNICKDYVRGFDHHCPAFGNCIGEKNHILFMVLLIGFIAVESLFILCTFEFATKYELGRKRSEIINSVNIAVSTMLFCLLQVLWQVVFLSWHVYCICFNIKTDEWINWKKYPEFQLMSRSQLQSDHTSSVVVFTNPYDKGILRNMKEFLWTEY